jgi:mRNA export factor
VSYAQLGQSLTIITAGWDRALNFWDPRAPAKQAEVALPERVFCMDVRGNDMVVCTAPENTGAAGMASRVHIFDLRQYQAPVRSVPSPLKYQSRTVRIFADNQLYALGSIEGRCRINALRAGDDAGTQAGDPQNRALSFAFRCHRDGKLIYPVNAIDCYPNPDPLRSPVFATAGSDGVVTLWNRRERSKIKDVSVDPSGQVAGPEGQQVKLRQPVTDVKFNAEGTLLAYAASYDWSRGPENYDKTAPPYIYLKNLSADYLTVKK